MTMEVRGRHIAEGIPKSVTISDAEVRDALRGIIDILVHAVRDCSSASRPSCRPTSTTAAS